MNPEPDANAPTSGGQSGHHKLAIVLIVVAALIGILSVFSLWSARQLLDQSTWSQTSQQLIQNSDIQTAVADYVVTQVYDNVDVKQELANGLPPELAPLAGPAASALRQPAESVAVKALQQPKVQNLWVAASDAAHQKLIDLVENKGQFVSTSGGVVTLDLQSLLDSVSTQLGIGSKVVAKLPASTASIEIVKSNELSTAQKAVKALKSAAWFLTALTLVLFALAIYVGRGRRRETLRDVGIALIGAGVVVLFVRGIAGNAIVNSLSGSPSSDSAVKAAFNIGTSLLKETGQSIVVYGIVVILAAWISGPAAWATSARRSITPWLRQPRYAFGGLALVLILLFWWGPLVATQRLIPAILLIVLAAAGVEVLRRQVIREFPDLLAFEKGATPGQGIAGWFRGLRGPKAQTVAGPASGSNRVADLEKLANLHDSGALSDSEFEAEKARLNKGTG